MSTKHERNFFSLLRTKIEKKPGRDFDRRFWNAFDEEFAPRAQARKRLFDFTMFRVALTSAAVIALTIGVLQLRNAGHQGVSRPEGTDVAMVSAAVENAPMLENMELFAAFNNIDDLSDSDWDVLGGKGGDENA